MLEIYTTNMLKHYKHARNMLKNKLTHASNMLNMLTVLKRASNMLIHANSVKTQ